jgi:peptide/nickel transport system substrate-binding protein
MAATSKADRGDGVWPEIKRETEMDTGYWSRVSASRLTRRRGLAAVATGALGAAFLAACGGDGGSTREQFDKTGLVLLPKDESDDGKPGGILPFNHGALDFQIDPILAPSLTSFAMVAPVYSQLVKYGKAVGSKPTPAMLSGDAATGWEISPDGLEVTYKLRPNMKFDPRPPTNGRIVTTQDIKFSFDRTEKLSPLRSGLFRSAGQTGPVQSLNTPDSSTIVVKLAEPYGSINELFAYVYFYISPAEADGQFDPKSEARGSGPFFLERWEQGVVAQFRKNKDWYVKDRPFLDGIDKLFILEQATLDSQFSSKQLWQSPPNTQPAEILRLKKAHPELAMKQLLPDLGLGAYPMYMGTSFANEPRLRRAASMMIDRDGLIDAVYSTKTWTDAGLEVPLFWDGHLCSNGAVWSDPKGTDLGAGAKWFQYDVAEAKKLLSAAGYTNNELPYIQRANFGPPDLGAVVSEMLKAGGFNVKDQVLQADPWRNLKTTFVAQNDGFFYGTANSFNDDEYLVQKYTPSGRDRASDKEIPGITQMVNAIRREFDPAKKTKMIKDIQKDLADLMPDIPIVSTQPTLGFDLTWPWLRNTAWTVPGFNAHSSSARPYVEYFVDSELKAKYG